MPLEQQKYNHTPKPIMKKRKKRKLSEELSVENTDGETRFCLSLVDILNKLSPRKNLLAKSKIMLLLVELMDD